MRILLIQPPQGGTLGLGQLQCVEPLNLETLAGAVEDKHQIYIQDMRLNPDSLAGVLRNFQPDLAGISSSFTSDFYRTLQVAQQVKRFNSRTFVTVGGHHPSLCPMDFHHPAFDAIVVGEGELTFRELAQGLTAGRDPADVPGLVLNRSEGQRATSPRPLVMDLDQLPRPRRELTRPYRDQYYLTLTPHVASVETTRGCPYRCRFCSVWSFYGSRVRFKSPKRVVDELAALQEPHIFFTDDNFLANPDRAGKILRLIQQRGLSKSYTIQARSDTIASHPELLARWRKAGLRSVFIGFEKPSTASLEALNKHNSAANNEAALGVLRDNGIEPVTSFIVDPDYGHDDFASLRGYVQGLRLRLPAFTVLTPLPGTALFHEAKARLTTLNYELFDLLHAVLPTRLDLPAFYAEMGRLWARAYPGWQFKVFSLCWSLREWGRQKQKSPGWRRVAAELSRLADAASYLAGHQSEFGLRPQPQPG